MTLTIERHICSKCKKSCQVTTIDCLNQGGPTDYPVSVCCEADLEKEVLTKEQEKWLTEEFLGLCWHYHGGYAAGPGYLACQKCNQHFDLLNNNPNLDFTDWRTFGLLWEKMQKHERWEEFVRFHGCDIDTPSLFNPYIHPDLIKPVRFALAICEFFNGGNDDRARTY